MYFPESPADDNEQRKLAVLESHASSPDEAYENDPEFRAAFEDSLRELASDIVKHHPGLAHILIGMSRNQGPYLHGQN